MTIVVLPLPELPIIPIFSPFSILNDIFLSISSCALSYLKYTFLNSILSKLESLILPVLLILGSTLNTSFILLNDTITLGIFNIITSSIIKLNNTVDIYWINAIIEPISRVPRLK